MACQGSIFCLVNQNLDVMVSIATIRIVGPVGFFLSFISRMKLCGFALFGLCRIFFFCIVECMLLSLPWLHHLIQPWFFVAVYQRTRRYHSSSMKTSIAFGDCACCHWPSL